MELLELEKGFAGLGRGRGEVGLEPTWLITPKPAPTPKTSSQNTTFSKEY